LPDSPFFSPPIFHFPVKKSLTPKGLGFLQILSFWHSFFRGRLMTAKQAGLLAYRSSESCAFPDLTVALAGFLPDYSGATASFTDDTSFELPYSPLFAKEAPV